MSEIQNDMLDLYGKVQQCDELGYKGLSYQQFSYLNVYKHLSRLNAASFARTIEPHTVCKHMQCN